MGMGHWRKLLFAVVPGVVLSTAAIGNEWNSSRRTFGPPLPPPDAEEVRSGEIVIGPGQAAPYYGMPSGVPVAPGAPYYAMQQPGCGAAPGCCDIQMDCCDACQCWTVRAGAIFLRRDSNSGRVLTDGATPITVGSLDTDYNGGPYITAIRHGIWDSCWDLEVTYYGVYGMEGDAFSAGATTLFTDPASPIAGDVTMGLESRLNSTEVNLRRQVNDWVTFLAGFRAVNVGEDLATDVGGGAATLAYDVNNHLYGAQIGLDALLWQRCAFRLEGFGKAGIYSNSVDNNVTTVGIGGALPAFGLEDNRTAFVGEAALTGVYQFNDRWSLRGGYQMLWVDGVALAPDQFGAANLTTGVGGIDYSTAFYHGFTVAAELTW